MPKLSQPQNKSDTNILVFDLYEGSTQQAASALSKNHKEDVDAGRISFVPLGNEKGVSAGRHHGMAVSSHLVEGTKLSKKNKTNLYLMNNPGILYGIDSKKYAHIGAVENQYTYKDIPGRNRAEKLEWAENNIPTFKALKKAVTENNIHIINMSTSLTTSTDPRYKELFEKGFLGYLNDFGKKHNVVIVRAFPNTPHKEPTLFESATGGPTVRHTVYGQDKPGGTQVLEVNNPTMGVKEKSNQIFTSNLRPDNLKVDTGIKVEGKKMTFITDTTPNSYEAPKVSAFLLNVAKSSLATGVFNNGTTYSLRNVLSGLSEAIVGKNSKNLDGKEGLKKIVAQHLTNIYNMPQAQANDIVDDSLKKVAEGGNYMEKPYSNQEKARIRASASSNVDFSADRSASSNK